MNVIELKKADRLGLSTPEPLSAWITFFKHWQEEHIMGNITHPPVQEAMHRIRSLSADEEARRLAFVRERALRDEISLMNQARREGREEGRQEGQQEAKQEMLHALLQANVLSDAQIASVTGVSLSDIVSARQRL